MPTNPWPFADPKNVAVFTTTQVIQDGRPVLYVSHDPDDGAWQFHTGDEAVSVKDAMVVALSKMIEIDPSLIALHDLPIGWTAQRDSQTTSWVREPKLDEAVLGQLAVELRQIQAACCGRRIEEINALLDDRSRSDDLIRVLDEYPATFISPPDDFQKTLNIIHLSDSSPERLQLSIHMPLWSSEEGRSDLEIRLWAVQHDTEWCIEIHDILVP